MELEEDASSATRVLIKLGRCVIEPEALPSESATNCGHERADTLYVFRRRFGDGTVHVHEEPIMKKPVDRNHQRAQLELLAVPAHIMAFLGPENA